MKCPKCHELGKDRVLESRESPGAETIRRRRECGECGERFTTYERIERPTLLVVKRDGSQELFDRKKLGEALVRAVGKFFSVPSYLEELVSEVEERAYKLAEENAIRSIDIGEMILDELAKKNEVAYVRFASVYKNFKSVDEFEKELLKLKPKSGVESKDRSGDLARSKK
jgi:transcriptional repressor NrdR